jgi:hypothetical protein
MHTVLFADGSEELCMIAGHRRAIGLQRGTNVPTCLRYGPWYLEVALKRVNFRKAFVIIIALALLALIAGFLMFGSANTGP